MKFSNALSEYTGKRILITGGAGCIGSNLIKSLLEAKPERIIVIDDLSASYEWNIPKQANIHFIKGSVLDEEKMRSAFSSKPHYVFHLAAHFANQNSIDHPEADLLTNALGTLKTLQYAKHGKATGFIYASSGCSVYGSKAPLPLREDYISLHLDTPYQISKLVGELYCNFFFSHYKLPVKIARYFNVYGPGEVPGFYRNVIPNFIWWGLHRKPLSITGTGNETRDFTFVDDVVEGSIRLGASEDAIGEAINLASGTETSIMEIAEKINTLTENNAGVDFKPTRDWDTIQRRRASIEKAKKIIGYQPKTNVNTGIKRTIDWIQTHSERIEQVVSFKVS